MQRKSLPPYGNIILAHQKEGVRLEFPIYVFVGNRAFDECRAQKQMGVLSTCLPADRTFNDFLWPVNGQNIIIMDCGGNLTDELNVLRINFYQIGARSVCVFSEFCTVDIFINQTSK